MSKRSRGDKLEVDLVLRRNGVIIAAATTLDPFVLRPPIWLTLLRQQARLRRPIAPGRRLKVSREACPPAPSAYGRSSCCCLLRVGSDVTVSTNVGTESHTTSRSHQAVSTQIYGRRAARGPDCALMLEAGCGSPPRPAPEHGHHAISPRSRCASHRVACLRHRPRDAASAAAPSASFTLIILTTGLRTAWHPHSARMLGHAAPPLQSLAALGTKRKRGAHHAGCEEPLAASVAAARQSQDGA